MDDAALTRASVLLKTAMRRQRPLQELPEECRPQTLVEAYAVQERFATGFGGEPVGYKIGATNPVLQQRLGLDEPFFGRLMSARVFESPAVIEPTALAGILVETEYGFHMAADLPAKQGPFDRDQVAAAVGALVPAIEIVDTRFTDLASIGALQVIADNALASYWIHAAPVVEWRDTDIVDAEIVTSLNGAPAETGAGRNVLGHPLDALRWLANNLAGFGLGLEAGDYVTTGSCTDIVHAEPGDQATADFGALGKVSVTFGPD